MGTGLCRALAVDDRDSVLGARVLGDHDFGVSDGLPSRQTNFSAMKDYCHGKSEFPKRAFQQSGTSDVVVEFVLTLLVANPMTRATAKGAQRSVRLGQDEY